MYLADLWETGQFKLGFLKVFPAMAWNNRRRLI